MQIPFLQASSITYILSQLANTPALLNIEFPSINVTSPATSVTKAASVSAPKFALANSSITSSTTRYVVIFLDLDAPLPLTPALSPILHSIWADLVPIGSADSDGWVQLETISTPSPAIDYLAPGPPRLSPPHRYLFMVWEQPDGLTGNGIRSALRLPQNPGLPRRIRWRETRCERKLKLSGNPIAGNYFLTGS